MKTQNLLDFCHPGIYEIYCHKAQKSYFGHSQNVLYRLGRHYNDLEQGECYEAEELQEDWLKYGRDGFEFRVLESGLEWKNKKKRVAREQEYFLLCKHSLYNQFPPNPVTFRKECTINGITYPSGAQAARELGISPSSIYRLLRKEKTGNFVFSSKKISIDGQEFSSLTEAMSVLNISKSTLFRRLRSSKYPTWFYIEKTRSNDYPERE